MIIVPVPRKFYVLAFLLLVVLVPALVFSPLLLLPVTTWLYWLLLAMDVFLLALVWRRSSSRRLTFFEGLQIIAGTYMSGCGNLTAMYIYPAMFGAYFTALINMIVGLKKGKEYTQQRWIRLVNEYEAVHRYR
jgi:Flp pilus assembly protein TadB